MSEDTVATVATGGGAGVGAAEDGAGVVCDDGGGESDVGAVGGVVGVLASAAGDRGRLRMCRFVWKKRIRRPRHTVCISTSSRAIYNAGL